MGIILSSGCTQQQTGAFAPLGGVLFSVDDTYYLVDKYYSNLYGDRIFNESEIKRQTGLDDIYPPATNPIINQIQAKDIAAERFNDIFTDTEFSNSELKDPYLIYNDKGEPSSWRVSAVRDNKVLKFVDIDPKSGTLSGGGGCPSPYDKCVSWFTSQDARSTLIKYLSENGIQYNEISEGRYIAYPRIVPR
jgi:hypothetical protein